MGTGDCFEFVEVEIRGEQDRIIGVGTTTGDTGDADPCSVGFEVEVPEASFYQIRIGEHRARTYSFEELATHDFTLSLSFE